MRRGGRGERREERARLNARIAELEESHEKRSTETYAGPACHSGESKKKGEKPQEGVEIPINDVIWEEELEERKRASRSIRRGSLIC